MKKAHLDIVNHRGRSIDCGSAEGVAAESLEVNVIFTEPSATAAALEATESFARELGACIRLRAAIVVPWQLPLDQPPVSVSFFERALRDFAGQREQNAPDCTVHLYICRNWIDTLSEVLTPSSLVVIGARKHWWPTAEDRMARSLRAQGHRVALVDFREEVMG
jgi:hypothetical protein